MNHVPRVGHVLSTDKLIDLTHAGWRFEVARHGPHAGQYIVTNPAGASVYATTPLQAVTLLERSKIGESDAS